MQHSSEYIEIEKKEIYDNLFAILLDEINGAEEYLENAEIAKIIEHNSLANIFIQHARDEIKHAEDIIEIVKQLITDLESNPLNPLFENIIISKHKIKQEIEDFR